MDYDQRASDLFVCLIDRIGAVDQRLRLAAEVHPFSALGRCSGAGFGSDSGNERRKEDQEKKCAQHAREDITYLLRCASL